MKAVLDHIGIAVGNLDAALGFYRDALGLEIEAPEEVTSQRVRAHFIPVGDTAERGAGGLAQRDRGAAAPTVKLELLEATASDSAIARYVEKRGPGLHHITLRVEDLAAALAQLKSRGVRLVDEQPRAGAEGALVAFIHPSSAHGVLVELKQAAVQSEIRNLQSEISRFTVGDLELLSLYDGFFRLDAGSLFGIVPKWMWASKMMTDERNRATLAMRPLLVRGVRTMLIDAGMGDHGDAKFKEMYAVDRARNLDHALAEAGVSPSDIDIVLATHLHFDHAGGFTMRDAAGQLRPKFPCARYVARRGEWDDATSPMERNRANYNPDNFLPLPAAGVLELVDDDQTIMPGVRVQRTGGHTAHHQIVWIESGGKRAVYAADLMPTAAHAPNGWVAAFDQFPADTFTAKKAFAREVLSRETLVFFDHDPAIVAGVVVEERGKRTVLPVRAAPRR